MLSFLESGGGCLRRVPEIKERVYTDATPPSFHEWGGVERSREGVKLHVDEEEEVGTVWFKSTEAMGEGCLFFCRVLSTQGIHDSTSKLNIVNSCWIWRI